MTTQQIARKYLAQFNNIKGTALNEPQKLKNDMVLMQIDLLKLHLPNMDDVTRQRALSTLALLQQRLLQPAEQQASQ